MLDPTAPLPRPYEARQLRDPVLTLEMEAIHRYEGTVNQVMGDGIIALFGAPLAHEDHPMSACYAALRMQDAIGRYAEEPRQRQGLDVQNRATIGRRAEACAGLDTAIKLYRAMEMTLWLPQVDAALARVEGQMG